MSMLLSKPIRILIVDDDELFSKSLSFLLEEILQNNCYIEFAYSGTNALDLLFQEKYELVFLDNKLQDMTGLEILKELRTKKLSTNVIMITGYSDEELAVKAMKLGAIDYISKGNIDIPRLLESINELFSESCSSLEIPSEILAEINEFFSLTDEIVVNQILNLTSLKNGKIVTSNLLNGFEELFEHNYVDKTSHFSTVTCPKCNSLPSEYYLSCPICYSQVFEKGEVIEHNKCHHIDFKSNFVDENNRFLCPKCGEELNQIGVDYVKVGSNYKCENSHIFPHLEHKYVCSECGDDFTEAQADILNVFKYRLLAEGKASLNLCESVEKYAYPDLDEKTVIQ